VDMLDTSTQKLVLLHAGGGTGPTFVTCKIFKELARRIGNLFLHMSNWGGCFALTTRLNFP
jgi:hypothetical protein